ncbi:unnamed protein product [Sphagnum jensenii]|uniref:3-hydroxyisobutyrate dehydrogenase n=1 Tax=Sphagnum jensenii TaxID=128206 RepID=A0ABP1BH92_9BRYO
MRAFAEKGADIAPTPHNLADACDVVITMLPSSPHIEVVIDAEKIGAAQESPLLLDAPVSGGVVPAQAATLTFVVKKP